MQQDSGEPWKQKNSPWKTESAFWSWLRGGLRRAIWNKHPLKLEFIKQNRTRIPGIKEGTTRWGGSCNLCSEIFPQSQLEVDHVVGNISLRSWDDLVQFVTHMAAPQDLQLVCKKCHKIKSYAERYELSFDRARERKEVIAQKKRKRND